MLNNLKITFLTKEEIEKSEIEKITSSTHFSLVLNDQKIRSWACYYWLKDDYNHNNDDINAYINDCVKVKNRPDIAIRPAIKFSTIKPYITKNAVDYKYVEFGEYPQNVITSVILFKKLEEAFYNNQIKKTGKVYTTDSPFYDKDGNDTDHDMFLPYEHIEYEYEGNRYIRVTNFFPRYHSQDFNNIYWVQVEPIMWDVDIKNDIAVSHYALLSGIKYEYENDYLIDYIDNNPGYNIPFKETSICKFLNTNFIKEIIPQNLMSELISSDKIVYNSNDYNNMINKKFKQ